MTQVAVHAGDGPVILGVPHAGTDIPEDLLARLNDRGRERADTDWWVDRLYEDLLPGASLVKALFHRYVIDANRDPEGASLYPGQNTTALCPTTDFDGAWYNLISNHKGWRAADAEFLRKLAITLD